MLDEIRKSMQWLRSKVAKIAALHYLFSPVLICIAAVSTAPAVTVYSDSWPDATDPNYVQIVGFGLTEANYSDDWELHSVRATTTIRSPSGRTATLTGLIYYNWSSGSTFTARAEPKLLFNGEVGDYFINTHHYSTCPATELGLTSFLNNISLKKSAYRLIDESDVGGRHNVGTCGFGRVCVGVCAEGAFVADKLYAGPCQKRLQCNTLYAGGVCWPDTRVCQEISEGGECDP